MEAPHEIQTMIPSEDSNMNITTRTTTATFPTPLPSDINPDTIANIQDSPTNTSTSTFQPSLRFYAAFSSLCIIILMAAVDATSLAIAIPTVTSALHGSAISGFWAGTSFLLTSTIVQPVFGSFSDIFGRKPMILISLAFFGVGAILAAVTRGSMTLLLVGRSIQGVGGGGVLVLTDIVVTDLIPLRLRGVFMSVIGAMWAIGSVSGPIVGGAFAQKSLWRWIFWINLPFLAVGTPFVVLFLTLHFHATSLPTKLRRIDWVGLVLFIGSTTAFFIPISWGGVQYSWSSWRSLVPLLLSIFGLAAFVVWEERFAIDSLIRLSVMKNRTSAVTYFGSFTQGLILWGVLYFTPYYFEAVKQKASITSAVDMFPGTLTVAPAAIITSAMISKLGTYRWAIWWGWALTTAGMGLRILLDVHTPVVGWVLISPVGGVGMGMLYPSLTYALQAATPSKDQAYCVALYTFFRAAGQCVGVAVGGTVFENSLRKQILRLPSISAHASEWAAEASALVETARAMSPGVVKDDLLQSYANALKVVWLVMCVLSAVALVASLGTKHFSLDRELETEQAFRVAIEEVKVMDS